MFLPIRGQPFGSVRAGSSVAYKQLRIIALIAILALGLTAPRPLEAHGGGTIQLSGAAAGPYRVTVWTNPDPTRANTPLHVTVAVVNDAEQPVLDAAVLVQLYAAGGADPLIAREATTAQSTNKLFYEVDFSPPDTGLHRIEVAVSGGEGEGTVDFEVGIQPPANNTWLLIGLVALAVLAAAGVLKGSRREIPQRRRGSG